MKYVALSILLALFAGTLSATPASATALYNIPGWSTLNSESGGSSDEDTGSSDGGSVSGSSTDSTGSSGESSDGWSTDSTGSSGGSSDGWSGGSFGSSDSLGLTGFRPAAYGGHFAADWFSRTGELLLYPNPVRDVIHLRFYGIAEQSIVSIFNLSGGLLAQTQIIGNLGTISVNEIPDGMYFLKALNNGQVISQSFLITR